MKLLEYASHPLISLSKLVGYSCGKLFYQERLDKNGNPFRKRFFCELNQRLIENGYSLPWIRAREECLTYWRSCTNESVDGNKPSVYSHKPGGIVSFLSQFWSPEVGRDDIIMELGCGPATNLYFLSKLGYCHLTGIEINTNSINEMKKSFPELRANIHNGTIEDILPKLNSDSIDVIYTMGFAAHIHPKSNITFNEMARVAKKYICTLESESANCSDTFTRNYRRIFSKLGCQQLKSVLITKEAFPYVAGEYYGFTARLFAVE